MCITYKKNGNPTTTLTHPNVKALNYNYVSLRRAKKLQQHSVAISSAALHGMASVAGWFSTMASKAPVRTGDLGMVRMWQQSIVPTTKKIYHINNALPVGLL